MKILLFIILLFPAVCLSQIERRTDDFTGDVMINTVMRIGWRMMPAIMYKNISEKDTVYYLSLKAPGITLNIGERGAIVLFTDGTKWINENAEIDVDSDTSHDGWDYSTFVRLNKNDLELFSTKTIYKFRLYIYDQSINGDDAERFANNVNIIMKTN